MYKLLPNNKITNEESDCILRKSDNAFIPKEEANTDYQEYLQFLADGGVPEPADTPEEAE